MKKQAAPYPLRLPPDLRSWVEQCAEKEARSVNNFLILLVSQAKEAMASTANAAQ